MKVGRFIYQLQSKTKQLLQSAMTTVIPQRQLLADPKADHYPPKNILKNKPTNQAPSKPASKHALSEEKQLKQPMRRSIEKADIEENSLLAQKQATKNEGNQQNHLRNIIKNHEEEYRESKPFHKKYGTQNSTQFKASPLQEKAKEAREGKEEAKAVLPEVKNKTKESFNKKLNSNIIKDEETPSSKHSYRIKKIDNRFPKKIRDDLIVLNEEEHRLQMEILEIHKNTKRQLEEYKNTYKFTFDNIKKHFPELQGGEEIQLQDVLQHVEDKLKQKRKDLAKLEGKIETNPYLLYLKNLPEDIMELHSSEEEDEVQELPESKPRLENNIGSYATAMPGFKDKKHALNLRRTYDIFKDEEKQSRLNTHHEPSEAPPQERTKQDGENKVTVNNRLKDFLLS